MLCPPLAAPLVHPPFPAALVLHNIPFIHRDLLLAEPLNKALLVAVPAPLVLALVVLRPEPSVAELAGEVGVVAVDALEVPLGVFHIVYRVGARVALPF